nr:hypothetical protein [Tanacetum cinerariifolium]
RARWALGGASAGSRCYCGQPVRGAAGPAPPANEPSGFFVIFCNTNGCGRSHALSPLGSTHERFFAAPALLPDRLGRCRSTRPRWSGD